MYQATYIRLRRGEPQGLIYFGPASATRVPCINLYNPGSLTWCEVGPGDVPRILGGEATVHDVVELGFTIIEEYVDTITMVGLVRSEPRVHVSIGTWATTLDNIYTLGLSAGWSNYDEARYYSALVRTLRLVDYVAPPTPYDALEAPHPPLSVTTVHIGHESLTRNEVEFARVLVESHTPALIYVHARFARIVYATKWAVEALHKQGYGCLGVIDAYVEAAERKHAWGEEELRVVDASPHIYLPCLTD